MESSSAPEPGPMLDPQPLGGAPAGPKARSDRQGYGKGSNEPPDVLKKSAAEALAQIFAPVHKRPGNLWCHKGASA